VHMVENIRRQEPLDDKYLLLRLFVAHQQINYFRNTITRKARWPQFIIPTLPLIIS
jgi:hypothetical protein